MGNMTDAFNAAISASVKQIVQGFDRASPLFEYIQQLEIVQEYDEELDDLIWEHTPG
jgi:hypothetical protein